MGKEPYGTRGEKISSVLGIIVSIISLVGTVIYGTWFISTIEKRIALLEQNDKQQQASIEDFHQALLKASENQYIVQNRFETIVDQRLARMDDKVDKIYLILIEAKR